MPSLLAIIAGLIGAAAIAISSYLSVAFDPGTEDNKSNEVKPGAGMKYFGQTPTSLETVAGPDGEASSISSEARDSVIAVTVSGTQIKSQESPIDPGVRAEKSDEVAEGSSRLLGSRQSADTSTPTEDRAIRAGPRNPIPPHRGKDATEKGSPQASALESRDGKADERELCQSCSAVNEYQQAKKRGFQCWNCGNPLPKLKKLTSQTDTNSAGTPSLHDEKSSPESDQFENAPNRPDQSHTPTALSDRANRTFYEKRYQERRDNTLINEEERIIVTKEEAEIVTRRETSDSDEPEMDDLSTGGQPPIDAPADETHHQKTSKEATRNDTAQRGEEEDSQQIERSSTETSLPTDTDNGEPGIGCDTETRTETDRIANVDSDADTDQETKPPQNDSYDSIWEVPVDTKSKTSKSEDKESLTKGSINEDEWT